jgi:hypothetical protein
MANILSKAKAKKTTTTAKKDTKPTVVVTDPEFATALKEVATLDKEIKDKTARLEVSKGVVKRHGIDEYSKLYELEGKNVGSFNMKNEDGDSVMFLPADRYLKIDEESADTLKEEYGEDIVDENTVYSFKTSILEKYFDQIAELLDKAGDFMTDEEKDNLIEAKTSFSIKKGTIDKVKLIATEKKTTCKEVLEDIQPIYSAKNAKLA